MDTTKRPDSLTRSDGSAAYEGAGTGPLVVCAPGMGDLRQPKEVNQAVLRFLATVRQTPAVLDRHTE